MQTTVFMQLLVGELVSTHDSCLEREQLAGDRWRTLLIRVVRTVEQAPMTLPGITGERKTACFQWLESALSRGNSFGAGPGGPFTIVGDLRSTDEDAALRKEERMMAAATPRRTSRMRARQVLILLALLSLFGSMGCRGGGNAGVTMPRAIIDLSPPLTEDIAVRQFGHRACEFLGLVERFQFTPVIPSNPEYAFGLTRFDMVTHLGAHLDAPARLLKNGDSAVEVDLMKLYGPAQVLDLRWKDRQTALQVTDLENYKSQIIPNRILILYVGYTQPKDEDWPAYPPLSVEAAQWLADAGIKALATDMPSIGSFSRYADLMDKGRPPEEVWEERLVLFQRGIPIVEGLTNVSKLLAEENIFFVGFPLAIPDRSGAPMRAVALVF